MQRQFKLLAALICVLLPFLAVATPAVVTVTAQAQQRKGHINGVTSLVFSPNGALLASVGRDSVVRISEVATATEVRMLQGHEQPVRAVAFSPDGARLATAGEDTRVLVWDTATGKLLAVLAGHTGFVNGIAFSPDGATIVTGGEDARLILWDARTGRLRQVLRGHAGGVTGVAFSPDGASVASSSKDKTLKLWDASTGVERRKFLGHTDSVTSVAFARDGATLVSGSKDKTVKLWNVATGASRRDLRGNSKGVNSVAISADGTTVVAGGDDATVNVWEAGTGKVLKTLRKQLKEITSVAISPDGKTIATGSKDETIVLWDLSTGTPREITMLTGASVPGAQAVTAGVLEALSPPTAAAAPAMAPEDGPGGPILVITTAANKYSSYYAEILRNEGFNEFATADIGAVSAATLASYDLVILGEMQLSSAQETMLSDWVSAGGNLIAMRPDKGLAGLLGLTDAGGTLQNAYMLVNTAQAPGNGIVSQTMQYHGPADRYTLSGATGVATLYSNASTATSNPAVTLRSVGASGGEAAAFTFDLARSVVYTRQGNPAWNAQERDGFTPIRPDDLFYGASASDPQADWIDFSKVSIPQADEQQRLLANMIVQMNLDKKPLPRFWYLPHGKKAAVLMTGDDHANGGTAGRFDAYKAASAAGCSVADWECVRSTSYIYPGTAMTDAQATAYTADGFEIGLHINTSCADYTQASLDNFYVQQLSAWSAQLPSIPAPVTQRHHCIVWSDWVTGAQVQLSHGQRLDTSYYFWPPNWVQNRPGFFNGTAMPMRFTNTDGTMIDVYEAVTQMTDESGQQYPFTVNTLLDRAVGPEGYYGVYTINAHTDFVSSNESSTVLTAAQSRGVPVVSAKQVLTWIDGRNSSSFGAFTWSNNTLGFTITPGTGTNGLQAMLPINSANGLLTSLTRGGGAVPYIVQTIKGVQYAFFAANAGAYVAEYGVDSTAPQITSTSPAAGASNTLPSASVLATFSEVIDTATLSGSTFELRGPGGTLVPASVSYDAASNTARLQPNSSLAFSSAYTAKVVGGSSGVKDLAGNPLAADVTWSFTTSTAPACPCSIWSPTTTPETPSANDPNAIELGVKFQADVEGYITGVRFYKGAGNTGTHTGSLWSTSGVRLATATFANETATGWQEVSFSSPVVITANTTYIASYHTDAGNYAFNPAYFGAAVSNPPLRALQNGADGPNAVYKYGDSAFPTDTFNAANYWVDVVFTTAAGADTTPPTVSATAPAAGVTNVAPGTPVTATFSEAVDPATVSGSTFELRDAANALVAATVTYNAANRTATLTPGAALASSATYTARVKGGASGVKDLAGNPLAADVTWSFTTAAPASCTSTPCSIWSDTTVPGRILEPDAQPVELGVKFRSDVNGYVTGVRFYKGPSNTGTHTGSLWSTSGVRLATATFSNETASGWQTVTFGGPVAISANTTYIASYHTDTGNYSEDLNFFTNAGVDTPPLHALRSGVDGPNGVYKYGPSAFPTDTSGASPNYWVDVLFTTVAPPDTTPPAVSATAPANGATGVSTTANATATFSEPVDPATVSASTFELRDAGNALVAAAVIYDSASRTATLDPNAALAVSTTYTARVKGGASGVKDLAGNALAADVTWMFTTTGPNACTSPANAIVAENCLAGNPRSEWDVSGAGDASIQGYATDISVNRGATVSFKIKTDASSYRIDIYRLGYYGGSGARKVATIQPSATLPQSQPNCLFDSGTRLVDCGNWAVSASWAVPASATSGIYIARPVRADTNGASHIVFIVRDDASTSDLLFQTSDLSWQAYNPYGGYSLYGTSTNEFDQASRAFKVSYNRPFATRGMEQGITWVFNAEYPMVRWLEANGYNVSYTTGIDTQRRGNLITNHKVFMSVGHDEYWAGQQRANVEAARNAGVHLAFFSGNTLFWRTRWENSIDGTNTAYRTLVCYKETHANAKIDPSAEWTGTFRDPRFRTADPENALKGTIFMVNGPRVPPDAIQVPAADGKMRFWRNTSVANLSAGQTATLPAGTLGYEWDIDVDNGFRPAGLVRMSTTTVNMGSDYLQDYGSTFGAGTPTHYLTLYRHASGALVFDAGSIQWSWGLDANHDAAYYPAPAADVRMQQATVNLLADMSTQPATLQSGLVAASASTDTARPSSTITSPANGASVQVGVPITVSGTASDSGGVVGGVEVSVDSGASWHPATGRASWSYTWTPSANGSVTIRSRAADDSGNLETPSAGVTITVGSVDTVPPTVTGTTPANAATGVATGASVTATFNENIDPATVSASTFELRGPNSTLVAATVTYNGTSRTATLAPNAALALTTTYTAIVKGGASGVKDTSGNALAADVTWSFTTTDGSAPVTLIGETAIRSSVDGNPPGMAEAFLYTASASGTANKAYIYLDGGNNATQVVVGVYSNAAGDVPGTLLAQATITSPVDGAWNAVSLPSVSITSGTKYWITVLGPAGLGLLRFRDAIGSGGKAQVSAQTNLTTLPATWSAGTTYLDGPMSAYLTQEGAPPPPDTAPPLVAMTAPAGGATVSGTAVTLSANASDNVGVASVQFLVDGVSIGAADTTAPYSITWNSTTAANGAHTISARATDTSNNIATATPVSVTVSNADTTAPAQPTGLTAAGSAGGIALDWANNSEADLAGYNVYRAASAGGPFTKLNAALLTTSDYSDTAAPAGAVSYYRVTAVDTSNNESTPATADATRPDSTVPAAPTGLTATATASGIALDWANNSEADLAGYHVYRSASAGGPFTRLNAALLAVSGYDDTLAPSGTSFYQVTAVDLSGNESAGSTAASAAMTKPNRAPNPGFELDANGDGRPDSWTSSARFTRSNVEERSGTYSGRNNAPNNATYTLTSSAITGLTAGTTYNMTGWVNIPATSDAFSYSLQVRWRNASNGTISTVTVATYSAATGGWVKASANLVAPAGTTNALLVQSVTSLNATVYSDDFAFR